jgi:hypothetical protein
LKEAERRGTLLDKWQPPPILIETFVGRGIRPRAEGSTILWRALDALLASHSTNVEADSLASRSSRTSSFDAAILDELSRQLMSGREDWLPSDRPPRPLAIPGWLLDQVKLWWALSSLEPTEPYAVAEEQQEDRQRLRRQWRELADHLRPVVERAQRLKEKLPAYYRDIDGAIAGAEGHALQLLAEAGASVDAVLSQHNPPGPKEVDRSLWIATSAAAGLGIKEQGELILASTTDWTVAPCPKFAESYSWGDSSRREHLLGLLRNWRYVEGQEGND